ncbi:MAG: filamentous hemagglutinin N-terminal domain-containing protein, partial [Pseudomonadota bacterium]|nr:filamentous hemagglutinin N-terminal domain-containing protein [Pseudomonadota bacterium]
MGAELGQQHGANLFHSFNEFNLSKRESATFSGPSTVEHVISRVTGGSVSHLDGLLRLTIPEADFYFINPAGIHMGPHASLDISGSFHASTADVLRFEDGGNFNARHPKASILSVAPITAFGFLTDSPSSLTVENSQLSVSEQQAFSLIGGDITMNQAQLQAPFGRLNLASVAGEGEIALEPNALDLTGPRGNISIRDSMINLNGEGSGGIYLQGGQIVMAGSKIETHTLGTEGGRGIIIRADQVTLEGGELSSITFESGQGNNIDIEADSINLKAGVIIS